MFRIWDGDEDDYDEVHPHLYLERHQADRFVFAWVHGMLQARGYLDGEPLPKPLARRMVRERIEERWPS